MIGIEESDRNRGECDSEAPRWLSWLAAGGRPGSVLTGNAERMWPGTRSAFEHGACKAPPGLGGHPSRRLRLGDGRAWVRSGSGILHANGERETTVTRAADSEQAPGTKLLQVQIPGR